MIKRNKPAYINIEMVNSFVRINVLTEYQKHNTCQVLEINKRDMRARVRWNGGDDMWFDVDQLETPEARTARLGE